MTTGHWADRLQIYVPPLDAMNPLERFESLVLSQQPATTPWRPVTDYSFEARKAIEGQHPQLIKDVFQPRCVLDVGAGRGILALLLLQAGVPCYAMDANPPSDAMLTVDRQDVCDCRHPIEWSLPYLAFDLVTCREVLEHLTVLQIRQAVRNLCLLTTKYVYLTTRFAKSPQSLLDVDTSDDLDPTHISMLNQELLRVLFVLEGFKRRADLEAKLDWQQKGRVLVYERAI